MRTIIFIAIMTFSLSANSQNRTPDYYKCNKRVSGKWVFGIAPRACSVDPFISRNIVRDKFSTYVFDEAKSDSAERRRYVNELNHLLEKAAEYYLKKRNPRASAEEHKWWKRIVLTIASHESFLTHYRDGKDNHLRMMRGDFGHGHGLMQVDDRWHFANVESGKAAHIIKNLFYALDIFYSGWERSRNASCIRSSTDYYNRARSAYAVYNGGPARICRWTNPNDRWARNDVNFKRAFDQQKWKQYVDPSRAVASVDIACLVSDRADCSSQGDGNGNGSGDGNGSGNGSDNSGDGNINDRKVQSYKNFICALSENKYFCLSQTKYRFCLVNEFNLINEVVRTNVDRPVVLLRPSEICPSGNNIYEVGSYIKVNKNINLRATPGGRRIGLLSRNSTYQVLGSEIIQDQSKSRYYLVKHRGQFGFFYAGTSSTAASWASKTNSVSEQVLPVVGSFVRIQTRSGINLRHAPAGDKIGLARSREIYRVLDTTYVGSTNKFYVKISVNDKTGWIYAGQIHPLYSVSNWIRLENR